MKKVVLIGLILVLSFSAFASSVFLQDVGIRLGHGTILEKPWGGLHVLGGLTLGLNERLELDPCIIVPVAPEPFKEFNLGVELGCAVLGNRINKTEVMGAHLNTIVSVGMFTKNFRPSYLTLRVTPVSLGTPYAGYRESLLPIGVAWNFKEHTFSCFMSIALFDHYVKGTWVQLRNESGE